MSCQGNKSGIVPRDHDSTLQLVYSFVLQHRSSQEKNEYASFYIGTEGGAEGLSEDC